jgi:hypothetical protein
MKAIDGSSLARRKPGSYRMAISIRKHACRLGKFRIRRTTTPEQDVGFVE